MLALDLFVNLTHRSWVCLTVKNGVLSLDIFEIKKLTEQRSHVSSCVSLISGARCWLVDDSKAEWKQRDSGVLVDFFITLVSYSRLCLKWRSRQKERSTKKRPTWCEVVSLWGSGWIETDSEMMQLKHYDCHSPAGEFSFEKQFCCRTHLNLLPPGAKKVWIPIPSCEMQ